jgi:hypothetical protein
MATPRDTMRQRTYDWENDLFGLFDHDKPAPLSEDAALSFFKACVEAALEATGWEHRPRCGVDLKPHDRATLWAASGA